MFVIYIINYKTYDVRFKGLVETGKEAKEIMEKLALDFMAHEEGKRKARIIKEHPYNVDDILKGYYLFSPTDEKIDVYYKETISTPFLYGFHEKQETQITKVKGYSYAEIDENDAENDDNFMELG